MKGLGAITFILASRLLFGGVTQVDIENWRTNPPRDVAPGDLVFRRDNGVFSWLFICASQREKKFSHVGIVVEGGERPRIIHADANEISGIGCVREEGWEGFFRESLGAAVWRLQVADGVRKKIVVEARARLGVPFDSAFSLSDTNRLYCSEFVRESVNAATGEETIGVTDLGGGKRMVAVDDCYATNVVKIAECYSSGAAKRK